jgi:cytochrome oxidase assembly protein ShyY1
VFRLLVTSKWVALTGLLVIAVAGFGWLGAWQWSRVQPAEENVPSLGAGPSVTLESIYQPGEPVPDSAVGQPVRIQGEFRADDQLLVPERAMDGVTGYWVVTPIATAGGGLMPVVRGWTATAGSVDPPTGEVEVTGWLEDSEPDALRAGVPQSLPDGQVAIVSSAELLSLWDGDLYHGFVVLDEQRPPTDLEPVTPPLLAPAPGISWQSLAYSVQWWLFAAFAVFLWWRMLQADWADRHDGPPTTTSAHPSEA